MHYYNKLLIFVKSFSNTFPNGT